MSGAPRAGVVVGVGASRHAPAAELASLVDVALQEAGVTGADVRALATVDVKLDEAAILALAAARGWPLRGVPAATLATVAVPTPSAVVQAAVGTPSVAEAAAIEVGGGPLLLTKRRSAHATVAVAAVGTAGTLHR